MLTTPDGLNSWDDGRLTILGSDGYIEVRKEERTKQIKAIITAKPKRYWIGIGKDDFL